jgi:hypothetical protein
VVRFSLVIPTLRRADTLEHALTTLLAQSYADIEIVVQNNGRDPATLAVVERVNDARVRHFSTDDVVPMVDNWERALSNTTGEFITFIGDDDGLLPDACDVAARILDADDAEILSWQPFLYLWPQYWDERRQNRLQATVSFEFEVRREASRPLLERFYDFGAHYSKLPMLYNSFVKRSLIDRVRERHGKYFFGSLPDVTSGIVNAAFSASFLVSSRALSVAGLSQHSTGNRWTRAATRPLPGELERDFPGLRGEEPASASGSNLEILVAKEMKLMNEQVLRADSGVVFNEEGLVRSMAMSINDSPSRYDETKALILSRIQLLGIPAEDIAIPPSTEHPLAPADGVHVLGPYEVMFVIDGHQIGLRTISDAVRQATQLIPSMDALVRAEGGTRGAVPVVSVEPLSLTKGSDGAGALVRGWGEAEAWGTWSIDRESTMRVEIPPNGGREVVRLGLRYRAIPFPDGTPRLVRCTVGEATLHEWQFSRSNAQGDLVIEIPAVFAGERVDLTLVNLNPKSPAELGVSADERRLGLGVEEIRLIP